MRRRAKVDANHGDVVKALRQIGCSVTDLSRLGQGVPDLLVGYRSKNILLEVKDGAKTASRRKLTDDEASWMLLWKGRAHVVNSVAEAIGVVTMETT